jgi:hypothetical protein
MAGGINLTELKRYLKDRSREELVLEITGLFRGFPHVREYYAAKIGPDGLRRSLARAKKVIENEFFPERGFGKARFTVAKKAIAEFTRLSASPESIADLMLFTVETGIEFTRTYGDIDESFYRGLESMYERALRLISQKDLMRDFSDRCKAIIDEGVQVGWGFNETMQETYSGYFGGP